MSALVIRFFSLIIFSSLFIFTNPSFADDKNTIPLKKLFNVSKIDFNKKLAGHTATILSDGRLLIIGGRDDAGPLSSIFIYDAFTNQLKESPAKLINSRNDHTAVILSDGKVLIAGGSDSAGPLFSSELYDPAPDTISTLSNSMSIARSGHTATLLSDGRVLITGGIDSSGTSLDSAEIYDPKTQTFSLISHKLTIPRSNHTSTLMPDGRVIIIGGKEEAQGSVVKALNFAEVFNPAAESFTPLSGVIKKGRFGHTATLLPDGKILIALGAGYDYDEDDDDDDKDINKTKPYNNAELYDPVTDTFIKIAGKITDKRYDHTANLLSDAKIIIIGGEGKKGIISSSQGQGGRGEGAIILTPVIKDTTNPIISSITINNNPPDPNSLTPDPLILIRFSEPIRVTTLTTDTLILKKEDGTKTEGIISQSESGLLSFFTPRNPLSGGKGYTIELTSGITDTSGNPITAYTNTFTVPNPVPVITSINPTTAFANTSFNLTIKGTGFVEASQIKLGGYSIPTTYTNETEITGSVPSTAVKTAGNYPVTIENPAPGGGASNPVNLEIKAAINIQITSPPDNLTVSTPYVTIEGNITSTYPITETKVWGLPANTTGNVFSAPVILAPGANTITVTARDDQNNQTAATINITLQESPPPAGANIKGWIHGQAYDAITKAPIADAEIIAKGLAYAIHTDANGKYTYPVSEEGGYHLYIEKAGYVTAMRQAYVIIGRETIAEPAYLTPFDTKATVIRAAQGGAHTDTTGMVEVIIPANALPYDMPISATYMPTEESFPIPMPYGDNYIAGVQFTPEYVTFNQPVTIRIRNTLGFAPGTPIAYAYAAHDVEDQNTGFYDPGMGVVTADGQYIEYQLPHFSCMASTLPGPPDNPPDTDDDDDEDEECDGGNCSVGINSGNLYIDYFLSSYKILGKENGLTLLYNSDTVYKYIPVSVKTKPRSGSAMPVALALAASSGGGGGGGGITINYEFFGSLQEQRFRALAEEISSRPSLTTGIYYPHITVSSRFNGFFYTAGTFGGPALVPTNVPLPKPAVSSTKTSYRIPINNQIDSPFGAGWNISGYERLHINPDGNILLTNGASSLIFRQGFTPQPLTTRLRTPSGIAVDASDNIYVADSTDGSIYTINSSGDVKLLTKITSCNNIRGITIGADNNLYIATGYHRQIEKVVLSTGETSFYTGQLNIATLEDIVFDSKGNLYALDGGRGLVLKIAPNGTASTFASEFINPISITVDKDDNLYVTNNNNTGQQARCGVSYISKIDPAGNVSTYISNLNAPMGVTIDKATGDIYVVDTSCSDLSLPQYIYRITPSGLKELVSDKKIGSGYSFGLAYDLAFNSKGELLVSSTTAGAILNSRLNTTTYISPEGDYSILTKETDGSFTRRLKDGTTIRYSANGLMASKTDRNGNAYTYTHDANNRLTAITDSLNQTTTLNYSGGLLSSITDPFGRTTTFTHNGKNLTSITGPDGSTTQYNYDDRRLLTTKTLPGSKTYQYTYDQYGKIRATQAPTGETRQYLPASVQKLINEIPAGTGTPDNPAEPPLASDIKSQVTDGKGYTRYIKTDKTGVIEQTDALNRTTTYTRDTNRNPLQITLPDGNTIRMTYDEKGNLLSRSDQLNNTTRFTYESIYNQVSTIREPKGNRTSFAYDINGNLTTITDALNNATGITYNSKGLIASITDAQNNITQYTYNTLYQLEAITDALNNTTRFTYDTRGNIISITDAKGSITAYEYDILDRLIKVTDPQGGITTYTYTNPANCNCGAENSSGNITSIADANGNTTTFEYNPIGQLTKITDPLNNIKTYNYDMNRNLISITDAKGNIITYDYDTSNRLIKKTTSEGTTDYAYDLVDNLTTAQNPDITYNMGYDIAGRNTAVTSSLGKTLNYSYDLNSNRTGITTGTTYRYYSYDQLNRLISGFNAYTYDSLGRRTRMSLYGTYGGRIDINYSYDQLSRLTRLSGINTFNYTYDENSNRTIASSAAQITSPPSITAPSDLTTNIPTMEIAGFIDNPVGNNIQINNSTVAINNDNTFTVPFNLSVENNKINIKLTDALGKETTKDINITLLAPISIDAPSTITTNKPTLKITGTTDNPTGYTLKINGIIIPISPSGAFESTQNLQWGINSIIIEATNTSGQTRTKEIIATYSTAGMIDDIAVNPLTYELYGIVSQDSPARIIKISSDGIVNTIYTSPDGSYPYKMAFSPAGELYVALITGWGEVPVSDIIKINTDGTTTTIISPVPIYFYEMAVDANNNIYVVDNRTIQKIAQDGAITTIASFDVRTEQTATDTFFVYPYISGITVDSQGNIYASMYELYISGTTIVYAKLRIYKIAPDGIQTVMAEKADILEVGNLTTDNNGNIYVMEMDAATGCAAILKVDNTGAISTIAEDCNYSYGISLYRDIGLDQTGNIIIIGGEGSRILKARDGIITDYIQPRQGEETIAVTINVTEIDLSLSLKVPVNIRAAKYIYGTKAYTYDNLNRLASVMRGVLEEDRFSYDSVGNRLTDIEARSYTYNNANELLSKNGTSFQYDANGNMISKTNNCGTTSYQFDTENRLVGINGFTINCSLFTADYKYDPFGRRIEKTVNGTITRYVYDREDILFELDASGNIITEYVHGPGIDEPIAMTKNNQTYYYHADGLGSIIAITDSSGNVVQRYEYDSFGQITYQLDSNFNQPYTYTGREYDEESRLYYYRARYYDAKVGRFITEDPILLLSPKGDGIPYLLPYLIEEPQELHHYVYAYNNPLRYIDTQGYLGWDTVGKWLGKQIAKQIGKQIGKKMGEDRLITEEEEQQMLEEYRKKHGPPDECNKGGAGSGGPVRYEP